MRIVVWAGMPVLAHMGMRVHYLLPAALGKLGHEVFYCPSSWETDIPNVPDYMKNEVVPYIKVVSPSDFYDLFPADILIYIFTTPLKDENVERKLLSFLPNLREMTTFVVYYCLDLWEGWTRNFPVHQWESEIVRNSTHVFAVSPQLCVHLSRKYQREVFLLPNATPPWFKPLPPPKEHRHKIAFVVGWSYHRNLNEFFTLAKEFPDWDFYWIGGASGDGGTIGHSPLGNAFLLSDKLPHEVSSVARTSMVGIVPGNRTWFSYFNDPAKWYIYHGCGLPVVSTYIPQYTYTHFYPFTFVGRNLKEGFRKFLSELPSINYPVPFSPVHTYEHRARTFLEVLKGESKGYGRSLPTYSSWREVYNEGQEGT